MKRAIAVIDIGMTNKKVAVYDRDLRLLDSSSRTFEPLLVEGLETHDLAAMELWFLEKLAEFGAAYPLGALAVATHGATMVCVGEDGQPCAPCVYYTHEPGPEFQERFYAVAGDRRALQRDTGTPPLSAMINPSKGVFFLKERFPEEFAKTRLLLNYPQYWGYRLTGQAGAEGTYAGCHSYLWDWKAARYSSVAAALGIEALMPFPLRDSWEILGPIKAELAERTGLSRDLIVTMGIHDSNASLLPHLSREGGGDFVLNSTGTWCVLMHPQAEFGFREDELGKIVFFNRSAYNKPVKTAIFLGGMEYEAWSKAIASACGGDPGEPGMGDYASLLGSASEFILPELVPGSGQFPGSRPRAVEAGSEYALGDIKSGLRIPAFLREGKRAMAALNVSLALQTMVAVERTGLSAEGAVHLEGGFRKNRGYAGILAALLGRRKLCLTDIPEATALGAAMTAVAALEGTAPDALGGRLGVEYRPVEPMRGSGGAELDKYAAAWLALVASDGGKA